MACRAKIPVARPADARTLTSIGGLQTLRILEYDSSSNPLVSAAARSAVEEASVPLQFLPPASLGVPRIKALRRT